MRPLVIFTRPEDATVELRHDNGQVFSGGPGQADNRVAHLIPVAEDLPEGNGAQLTITWPGSSPLVQRGVLWVKERDGRALPRPEFIVDDFTKPDSF